MKKLFILLTLIIISIMIFSEPYRPYPIIAIHGYNADHYNTGNFGTVINSNTDSTKILNPTSTSPVPEKIGEYTDNYISRNECKRLEEGKLAYRCLEYNEDVLNYWHELNKNNPGMVYWTKNDNLKNWGLKNWEKLGTVVENVEKVGYSFWWKQKSYQNDVWR